jgi:ABC-type bacteriocin/lantibiotic exporter with double-glycine peptidase domain
MIAATMITVLVTLGAQDPSAASPTDAPVYDCGTLALFTWARLHGQTATLSDIEAQLPALPRGGYSLLQLRDAARALGLRANGVALGREPAALDGPALAFLTRGGHGHFIVIRPVGHTGRLVQVIDPTHENRVLDLKTLIASEEWSGAGLVVDERPWTSWGLSWIVAALVPACLVAWAWRRRTGRAVTSPGMG